ncbi:ribonuclease E/G [Buchnera aphidicola]|uniref:ribonuclease E/G n=1 Tax=Buchnera aphidicola TaxID=9 RepID=UPI002543156D|nr:ribonuclease E/G [Buchnera aphidicola]WII23510.1 ribonuclease E/G [Buchnera aphidicola (Sipha maydis)]
MKKMFIKVNTKEIFFVIVKKKKIYNININKMSFKSVNNIYLCSLKKISHSLEAIFVDYGGKKLGLLPFKNISKKLFSNIKINFFLLDKNYFIKNKKKILIQILKLEKKNKGGLLTTFITLLGVYVILIINKPHIRKISNKIQGEKRKKLKFLIKLLKIPKNMGIILRTSASGKLIQELQKDCTIQIKKWNLICKNRKNILLLKSLQIDNIFINLLREIICYKISQIIIDNNIFFIRIKSFLILFNLLDYLNKIKLFKKNISIFHYYNLQNKISAIFDQKIKLSSNISLYIDFTEALTVIDINSSSLKNFNTLENTAFNINFFIIPEIIRQIRLKDIGGIIIIDFISMRKKINKKIVEKNFKFHAKKEFSRIIIGKISKFGLLEISRRKIYNLSYIVKKKIIKELFLFRK